MSLQDFEAIGVSKRGFQLKLVKEAKKLPGTNFEVKVAVSNLRVTRNSYIV